MYTGNLIDDLMSTVERAEKRAIQACSQEEKLAHFYAVAQTELTRFDYELSGVA